MSERLLLHMSCLRLHRKLVWVLQRFSVDFTQLISELYMFWTCPMFQCRKIENFGFVTCVKCWSADSEVGQANCCFTLRQRLLHLEEGGCLAPVCKLLLLKGEKLWNGRPFKPGKKVKSRQVSDRRTRRRTLRARKIKDITHDYSGFPRRTYVDLGSPGSPGLPSDSSWAPWQSIKLPLSRSLHDSPGLIWSSKISLQRTTPYVKKDLKAFGWPLKGLWNFWITF